MSAFGPVFGYWFTDSVTVLRWGDELGFIGWCLLDVVLTSVNFRWQHLAWVLEILLKDDIRTCWNCNLLLLFLWYFIMTTTQRDLLWWLLFSCKQISVLLMFLKITMIIHVDHVTLSFFISLLFPCFLLVDNKMFHSAAANFRAEEWRPLPVWSNSIQWGRKWAPGHWLLHFLPFCA